VIKTDEVLLAELRQAFARKPHLVTRDLLAEGCSHPHTYKRHFGGWSNTVKAAGQDPSALRVEVMKYARERHAHTRKFGSALAEALECENLSASYDGRRNTLSVPGADVHVRLVWRARDDDAEGEWHIRELRCKPGIDLILVVRMYAPFRAKDFLLVSSQDLDRKFPCWLPAQVPRSLQRYWLKTPGTLIQRVRQLVAVGSGSV
jgi:hypothetical protein